MEQGFARLTVYFEDPFWVAVYEREAGKRLEACKITFGAEPRDCEVYEALLAHWRELEFSPAVEVVGRRHESLNPKRAQRKAQTELERRGVGTKAQQALQLQREQHKEERQARGHQRDEAERERKFTLRQEKKKEKHRGH